MSGHRRQTPERLGTRLWVTVLVVLPVSLGLMLLQQPVSGEETLVPGSDFSAEWAWPHGEEQLAGLSERSEVNALLHEMTRAMNGLQLPSREPPYYLAYTLLDIEQRLVVGQLGAIVQNDHDLARSVHVEVRVGSAELDNSHVSPELDGFEFRSAGTSVPLGHDPLALKTAVWLETDQSYREASEALEQKRTARANAVDYEQRAADFSPQPPLVHIAPPAPALTETARLQEVAERVSAAFTPYEELHESVVTVAAWRIDRTLITSEGSLVVSPTRVVEVTLECHTQAPDGMPLSHRKTVFGELDVETLVQQAQALAQQLTELRQAPLAPDYVGPVLFAGEAAPQIVLELLGQSLIGTPVPGEGPLSRRLQRRVLPTSFNVVDDPTLTDWNGEPLLGSYVADDEGVMAQRVQLVQEGVLQTLLMSRTPSREITLSNGHGRTGYAGWTRGSIGNLILTTVEPHPHVALRRTLRASGESAIEIERLSQREFSSHGATPPEVERAFLVTPDGKRTLVRGTTLGEMQVRDLKDIIAAGNVDTVYHSLRNAGAYSIPVSVISPALLFEEVEVKKPKRSPRLPKVIPRPPLPKL